MTDGAISRVGSLKGGGGSGTSCKRYDYLLVLNEHYMSIVVGRLAIDDEVIQGFGRHVGRRIVGGACRRSAGRSS